MDCEDNKREYLMELLTAFRYINITILYGLEHCGSWEKFKFVDIFSWDVCSLKGYKLNHAAV